jgi:hypothetical protein
MLQVLTGVVLGVGAIFAMHWHEPAKSAMLIPLLAIGLLAAIIAHEAGHAAAALLQRFRIAAFGVWPVRVYRESSCWRIGWLPRISPAAFISILPIGTQRLRVRQFVIVAAGPVASIVAGAGCWIAMGAASAQPKWVGDQLFFIAVWSALIGAAGLLPVRRPTMVSDGMRLHILIRGGPECDRISTQLAIIAAALDGARPKEWPAELIERAVGSEDGSAEAFSGRALRYNWFADQCLLDKAEEQLVWLLLQPVPDAALRPWRLQAAWFAAFFRQDAITARKWFDVVPKSPASSNDCDTLMAAAALAVVEGRHTDATQLIPQALKECERLQDRGAGKAIHEALLVLANRVEPASPAQLR